MGALSNSLGLFRTSLHLIGREKKLLIFPLFSILAVLVIIGVIASGVFAVSFFENVDAFWGLVERTQIDGRWHISVTAPGWILLFALYLASMIIGSFCNMAFYSEIFHGLRGEAVSVARGFSFAFSRLRAIFLWSLLAATVGIFLRALEEKMGIVGRFVIGFLGVAWAVASLFVIPVLAVDPALNNPLDALKRSAQCIKESWGESLTGFIGYRALNFLAATLFGIIMIACIGFGAYAYAADKYVMLAVAGVVTVITLLSVILYAYLMNTAKYVYIAAMFLYASGDGEADGCFSAEDFSVAFRHRE